MKVHFARSDINERRQADDFAVRFGCDLERVPQGPGVTGDYMVFETGDRTIQLEALLGFPILARRIEFKCDHASVRTKNLYIEYEQTSDAWFSTNPSGHAKAIADGHILIISSGPNTFIFNEKSFAKLLKGATTVRTNRPRINGNHPGCHTRAKLVPVKVAFETATFVYNVSHGWDYE